MVGRWAPVAFVVVTLASIGAVALIAWAFVGGGDDPPERPLGGAPPVLTVAEVRAAGDDLPPGLVTVVGTFDAVVPRVGEPRALVLEDPAEQGRVLVVPDTGAVPDPVLDAGGGRRVAALGELRIATATNPPPGGGELRAEFLGEPVLDAQDIAVAGGR